MPGIKLFLPWITSWIWQVRLNYSTSYINRATSLFPFQPFLFSGVLSVVFRAVLTLEGREGCMQRSSTGWRKRLMGTWYKGKCKTLVPEGITPRTSTGWSLTSWTASLQKRSLQRSWRWASNEPLQQGRPAASWAALGRTLPASRGRWSLPSAQHWWDNPWVLGPVLGSSAQGRHGHTVVDPAEATGMAGAGAHSVWGEAEPAAPAEPGEEASGGPHCNLPLPDEKVRRRWSSSWGMHSNKARGSRH